MKFGPLVLEPGERSYLTTKTPAHCILGRLIVGKGSQEFAIEDIKIRHFSTFETISAPIPATFFCQPNLPVNLGNGEVVRAECPISLGIKNTSKIQSIFQAALSLTLV